MASKLEKQYGYAAINLTSLLRLLTRRVGDSQRIRLLVWERNWEGTVIEAPKKIPQY